MLSVNIFDILKIQFFFFVSVTDARLQPPETHKNQDDGLIYPFCVYDCPVPDQKKTNSRTGWSKKDNYQTVDQKKTAFN